MGRMSSSEEIHEMRICPNKSHPNPLSFDRDLLGEDSESWGVVKDIHLGCGPLPGCNRGK